MKEQNLFNAVIFRGIAGAFIGIAAGLVLSMLIWGLESAVLLLKHNLTPMAYDNGNMPVEFISMLGMGFGALSGSILGGLTALFEFRNKKN